MKYNHVGRPTNEEVAARKKKAIMKVLLPFSLVTIVTIMIISDNGLKELMGNETFTGQNCHYTCEEGWAKDGSTCYQETKSETYVVGDVINEAGELVPDGKAQLQDYNVIIKDIENNKELDEKQQLIYDLNGDGVVNNQDVDGYSTSTTGEYELICPDNKIDITEENGIKTIVTRTYQESGDKCLVNKSVRQEKQQVCEAQDSIDEHSNVEAQNDSNGTNGSDDDVIIESLGMQEDTENDSITQSDLDSLNRGEIVNKEIPLNNIEGSKSAMGNKSKFIAFLKILLYDRTNDLVPIKTNSQAFIHYIFNNKKDCEAFGREYDNHIASSVYKSGSIIKTVKYYDNKSVTISSAPRTYALMKFTLKQNKIKNMYIRRVATPSYYVHRSKCHQLVMRPGETRILISPVNAKTKYRKNYVEDTSGFTFSGYTTKVTMNLKKGQWSSKHKKYYQGSYIYNKTLKKYLCKDNKYHKSCSKHKGKKIVLKSGSTNASKYLKSKNQTIQFKQIYK